MFEYVDKLRTILDWENMYEEVKGERYKNKKKYVKVLSSVKEEME